MSHDGVLFFIDFWACRLFVGESGWWSSQSIEVYEGRGGRGGLRWPKMSLSSLWTVPLTFSDVMSACLSVCLCLTLLQEFLQVEDLGFFQV